jgi:hypothetical protein
MYIKRDLPPRSAVAARAGENAPDPRLLFREHFVRRDGRVPLNRTVPLVAVHEDDVWVITASSIGLRAVAAGPEGFDEAIDEAFDTLWTGLVLEDGPLTPRARAIRDMLKAVVKE